MKPKKSATKNSPLGRQLLWFVGIYLASIVALAIFHEFSQLVIKLLK